MTAKYIDSLPALREMTQALAKCRAVALDTEFLWERTYYPVLGLLQVADDTGACWLVDPIAIGDISPLAPIMEADSIVKVLHDAGQDLMIIGRATGVAARNVFDTRLAAGFAGLPSTLSLQRLVAEIVGIPLPKDETRSDWTRRPLRPEQLEYAANDVAYLLEIRDSLISRCADDEVRSWLAEEMSLNVSASDTLSRNPRDSWLRVGHHASLDLRHQAVLRELAAWREECARSRDIPRARWIADDALLELARIAPSDVAALSAIRGVPRTWSRDNRAAIVLRLVERAMALPNSRLPRNPPPPALDRDTLRRRTSEMRAFIDARAKARGIDPAVVASRADIESLVVAREESRDTSGHPLCSGWRKALLGD